MGDEERLRRIDERHEALAQTVGILGGMQVETERQIQGLAGRMEKLTMSNLTDTMNRLANIVIS